MLVRDVTQDKEGVTDLGAHHLRYAYLPHAGDAMDTQAWKYAYEFNQPLIAAWKSEQAIHAQIPFDDIESRELERLGNAPPLPGTLSMLSAQGAVIADLYRQGDQIEAVILNYNPIDAASIRMGNRTITLPQSVFTLQSLPSLELPLQK